MVNALDLTSGVAKQITSNIFNNPNKEIPFSENLVFNIDMANSPITETSGKVTRINSISPIDPNNFVRQNNIDRAPRLSTETLANAPVLEYQDDDIIERGLSPSSGTFQNNQAGFIILKALKPVSGSGGFFNENIFGLATATNVTLNSTPTIVSANFQNTFTNAGGSIVSVTNLDEDRWYVLHWGTDPATPNIMYCYIDGVQVGTITHNIDIPANQFGGPRLDKASGAANDYGDKFVQYLFFNRSLSSAEHTEVYEFLKNKWGL